MSSLRHATGTWQVIAFQGRSGTWRTVFAGDEAEARRQWQIEHARPDRRGPVLLVDATGRPVRYARKPNRDGLTRFRVGTR